MPNWTVIFLAAGMAAAQPVPPAVPATPPGVPRKPAALPPLPALPGMPPMPAAMPAMPGMPPMSAALPALPGMPMPMAMAALPGMPPAFFAEPGGQAYERGQRALDNRKFEEAVAQFTEAAKGPRADGALYWKAYALHKLGRRDEALNTLAELRKTNANSRWADDAKALEIEVRQASGQTPRPEAQADDDLKLIALSGLAHQDPERAVPLLEKLLQGNQPPKIKDRALFVLAQIRHPKGAELLGRIARGGANPDLQRKAVRYIATMAPRENRKVLEEVYRSTSDPDVKAEVLLGYMVSGDRATLLSIAKSEQDARLRGEAIRQLAITGGQEELWQLYQAETSAENRENILRSLFLTGDSGRLAEVARNEKDPKLRRAAIRSLGLMGANSAELLPSLYAGESDAETRAHILNAMFIQGNAKGIVKLARKEKDPELKKKMVHWLSMMPAPEARQYMLEVLEQ